MRIGPPAGPYRRLVVLLLGLAFLPMASLAWLGWLLLEDDRRAAASQMEQQFDQTAVHIASAITRAVATDEHRASAGAVDWQPGAVLIRLNQGRVTVQPPGRIAYYPLVDALPEASPDAFDAVDLAEFRNRDRALALDLLKALAVDAASAVSRTARFRLAGMAVAMGQHDRALREYAALAGVDDVGIGGTPLSMAAAFRRCQLLQAMGRAEALRAEAVAFLRDLEGGRWRLTAPVYSLYAADARNWAGVKREALTEGEQLAAAVTEVWSQRGRFLNATAGVTQRAVLPVDGEAYAALWQSLGGGAAHVLLVNAAYVEAHWFAAATTLPFARAATLRLLGNGDQPALAADSRVLSATDTGLPWPVEVTRVPGPLPAELATRRRNLIASLSIVFALAIAACVFIGRAMYREMAVARLQSDFVAAVSHEFRTPLTALRQFTDMLRGDGLDNEQRRLCYDAQSRATERLTRLVESVLDFGRTDAGKRDFRFESVNCGDIVQSVVEDFRRDIHAAGYQVTFHSTATADIEADPEALGQALRNLLENAVKYSPDAREVEVNMMRAADTVSIAVRDRGIGVPERERRAIFDRFHRGDEARKRGIAGTGIGLAMVDHIVRAHKGRVRVESAPGEGSTFTIELPVAHRSGTA